MASFLTGAAAQLVGAGMEAMGVGIPVGETSAKVIEGLRNCGVPVPPKNWFKRSNGNKEQQETVASSRVGDDRRYNESPYDKLEYHINGMIQVVKPVIELKKLVRENCCKSAERPRRAISPTSSDNIRYYTPKKPSSSSSSRNLAEHQNSPSPTSTIPKRKLTATKKTSKHHEKRRRAKREDNSSDNDEEEEEHCMYCSRSRSLIKLPCGRLICSKCEETGKHELECKLCKEAEKCLVYDY